MIVVSLFFQATWWKRKTKQFHKVIIDTILLAKCQEIRQMFPLQIRTSKLSAVSVTAIEQYFFRVPVIKALNKLIFIQTNPVLLLFTPTSMVMWFYHLLVWLDTVWIYLFFFSLVSNAITQKRIDLISPTGIRLTGASAAHSWRVNKNFACLWTKR